MKRYQIISAVALLFSAFGMQSCLELDVTGAEFNSTSKNIEQVVTRGKVDSIPYKTVYTKAEVAAAAKKLDDPLHVAMGAQFSMRGGKKGETPGTHAYQYQFCLGVDNYAQYGVIPHSNFPYSKINITSTYNIDTKAYGGAMGSFKEVSTASVPLLNHAAIDTIPELKAIYLLIYNYSAIEVADIYGPFPYNDLKTNKQIGPYTYEDVRSIYMNVEANIDTIMNCFKYFETKPKEYQTEVLKVIQKNLLLGNDRFEGGYKDLKTWIRFANSLKLRMAMHIVKVEPTLARKWAEDAVAGGVIETKAQQVALRPMYIGVSHPLAGVYEWNDTRMTASMESLLKSLKHPYLNTVFLPNANPIINSKTKEVLEAGAAVVGMRSGTHPGEAQGYDNNQYIAFSRINSQYMNQAPLYVMKLSEVCFLRAEGAVRGWAMGGSAKDFYEQGIREGNLEDPDMKSSDYKGEDGKTGNFYDMQIEKYMELEAAVPFTYVDPTGDTDPIESVTKIGVKWNESDPNEVKLEKIITQKYLAGFPYSFEAWVDLRRTGYPKLFEVLNADEADGSLKQGDIIRRLPFPDSQDASVLNDIQESGLNALGGEDKMGTRLWWDVDAPNF